MNIHTLTYIYIHIQIDTTNKQIDRETRKKYHYSFGVCLLESNKLVSMLLL